MLKAVVFDMDGLMFDTESIAFKAWKYAGEQSGFPLPDALILQIAGNNLKGTQVLLENTMGTDFDFHYVRQFRLQYAAEYIEKYGVPIKKGLFELLDVLEQFAIPKAVATSTDRVRAENLLVKTNIFKRFNTVICGDEIENGKPAPEIFLVAADKLDTDPAQCIVLEDSEAGIRAAAAAQMRSFLVPDMKMPSDEVMKMVSHIFSDLSEVAAYFNGNYSSTASKI